ncbi:MAG: alpha/beta hydrolase [Nostoc sp. ChiSLP02]|nr:alpha/beta hydrolase [Nostoc sp. DedSLP05]MDZ8097520.1 alpha/beta hydrolase [Nostoc sp. DedSLP01]MDZ8187110.1 alpha/beta hydrolase [Nostoc sp. ChiSLP02]
MKQFLRQSLLSLIGASALLLQPLTTGTAKSESFDSTVDCSKTYLPVALAPGGTKQYHIYGELCRPPKARTVHVLVSGITYDRNYWNFPYEKERYSYVKALTKDGYATFNIDRIGIGNSSHPRADLVTVQSNAFVLNQVNRALRDGKINNVKFNRIINVGHSFGSVVVIEQASQYGDVDGVIISAFLHKLTPELQALGNFLYPAQSDPNFKNDNLPINYLTTLPGTRGQLLYNQSNADRKVIKKDEALKQTLTTGEAQTFFPAVTSDISKNITVPVLLVIGQKDNFFCSDTVCTQENVAAFEKQFYSPKTQLQVYIMQNAGHSVNLHLNASEWYKVAGKWSDRFIKNEK